ncbi:hypothetical protein J8F10_03515 [Gemmata sp. G18]|uniref:Uncharacterized protein n=1 Tax=Gemmata palustris TaxID=2822762 RepID=A0ABS5BM37_9BACT|nr:hypothetical protein [Gemmata palustris]MBP3954365.1 hypothetical protein [Gemmata palustris]
MTIWTFFDSHCFLAFLALCSTYYLCVRLIRMVMVLARGWPTPPLDADGEVVRPEKPEGEAA